MVRVRIGDSERLLREANESWINQQINNRRQSGKKICIRVFIEEESVNMVLSTCDCLGQGSSGRPRPHNLTEKKIFDLGYELGLDKPNFHGGSVIAFLKQLKE